MKDQIEEAIQCEDHVRLIREVQAALIRAGKKTRAGYVGRFAECIDEMAQEIRHLTSAMHSDGESEMRDKAVKDLVEYGY